MKYDEIMDRLSNSYVDARDCWEVFDDAGEFIDSAVDALKKIAQFGDEGAEQRLKERGLYSSFDEPVSVRMARETLANMGITKP